MTVYQMNSNINMYMKICPSSLENDVMSEYVSNIMSQFEIAKRVNMLLLMLIKRSDCQNKLEAVIIWYAKHSKPNINGCNSNDYV